MNACEDKVHLFTQCSWIDSLWRFFCLGTGQPSLLDVSSDERVRNWDPLCVTSHGRILRLLVPYAILWITWKERNDRYFEGKNSSLQQLIRNVKACVWGWTMMLPIMKGVRFDKVLDDWDSL